MSTELRKFLDEKVHQIQKSIVRAFEAQRDQLIKDIEGQAEFAVGDAAFSEVERSLKLLKK